MRHLVKGRKLGRKASHRKATLMALSVALIKSERIVTTLAKAKALRSYVEPIISRSKEDSTHNRSQVFRHLRDKQATTRLFDEIAPMVEDRPGGYTRIIKLGARAGDGAEKAMIELVDFNDAQPETSRKKKRRTRRGRAGGKKADEAKPEAVKKKKDAKITDKKVKEASENEEEIVAKQQVVTEDEPVKKSDEKKGIVPAGSEDAAEREHKAVDPAESKDSMEVQASETVEEETVEEEIVEEETEEEKPETATDDSKKKGDSKEAADEPASSEVEKKRGSESDVDDPDQSESTEEKK